MADVSARRTLLLLGAIPLFALGVYTGAKLFVPVTDEYVLKPEQILSEDAWKTYFDKKPLVQEALFARLAGETLKRPGSGLYDLYVVNRFKAPIDKYLGGIDGKTFLELGPGDNIATGLLLVLGGAEKYYGLDIYRPSDFDNPAPYRSVIQLAHAQPELHRRSAEGIFSERDGKAVLDPARVVHLYPHESWDMPLPDASVDVVFSHYSFEHFNDPQKTITSIHRVLKPGGLTLHVIGILDHRNFDKPWDYYVHDDASWRKMMLTPGKIHEFTNRWLAVQFKKAFEETGFEVLELVTEPDATSKHVIHAHRDVPLTEADKAKFAPEFQKYSIEELTTDYVFVVAKKAER